jgi:hypothetical protein
MLVHKLAEGFDDELSQKYCAVLEAMTLPNMAYDFGNYDAEGCDDAMHALVEGKLAQRSCCDIV